MRNSTTNKHALFYALIALFIVPISGLSVDVYVPSMPKMAEFFMTNKSLIQLSISFYMLGLGLMQILAGPISDSFGRKKTFYHWHDALLIKYWPNCQLSQHLFFTRFTRHTRYLSRYFSGPNSFRDPRSL